MTYTEYIFPHIKHYSDELETLSKLIWELFTYGCTKSPITINLKEFFEALKTSTERARRKIIQQLKQRVESIRRYNITDEQVIKKIVFLYPYPEINPKITPSQLPLLNLLCDNPTMPISKIAIYLKRSPYWVQKNLN